MEKLITKLPVWYWVVAIFFLLWNLMGVFSFFGQVFISDEVIKSLSTAEQELYKSYPLWTFIAFAIAVFGGTIGSIGLLMKKSWAKTFFIISLIGILPQMTFTIFFTKTTEIYGASSLIMPIMIIAGGIFLVWFSSNAIKRDWLR